MADKQVDGLDPKDRTIREDEVPVFDSEETGPEALKRVAMENFEVPKYNPFAPDLPQAPIPIAINGLAVNRVNVAGTPVAAVSVADFLAGMIDNNDPPYTYGLRKSGDASWVEHIDPRKAVYTFDCSDPSTILMEIRVMDNTGNWTFVESYVIIQDNMLLCAP